MCRPSSVCVHSDSPEQMLRCTVTYKPLVMEGLTCPVVTEQTPLLVGRLLKALKAAVWTELALQRLYLSHSLVPWAAPMVAGVKAGVVVCSSPALPVFRRPRKEDHKRKDSLGYILRL